MSTPLSKPLSAHIDPVAGFPRACVMTVDLEDWFHSVHDVHHDQWELCPAHIECTLESLLGILDHHSVRATFFVLGWIALHYSHLLTKIVMRRHEVACHGFNHRPIDQLSPDALRDDLRRSKAAIEDACGVTPLGYRAPYWSIRESSRWALEVIEEEGFRYDSSMFPARTPIVGNRIIPDSLCRPTRSGRLIEIPPTTFDLGVFRWPVSNGVFLRWTPTSVITSLFNCRLRDGNLAMICVHPSEVDSFRPFVPGGYLRRSFHMSRIPITKKLNHILYSYRFVSIQELLASILDVQPAGHPSGNGVVEPLPRRPSGS